MINHLRGIIIDIEDRSITLETHGVGYKVFVTGQTIEKLNNGKEASLWTHLAVREDAQTLYGFLSKDELTFFELLISSVSGVGPKTALGILNVSSVQSIRKAVTTGDTSHLTKVSGIGKKMAEKIVLELKGKFENGAYGGNSKDDASLQDEVDALEALKALGYGHKEVREALKEVGSDITDTGERIKKALKIMTKK